MSAYITLGHEFSGHKIVHKILTLAGLKAPNQAQPDGWCPEAMAEKIVKSHLMTKNGPFPSKQIKPGKAWNNVAANIILANIEQDFWGWASSQSIALLDFWQDYDPDIKFILVYTNPETTLARYILNQEEVLEISLVIDEWEHCNQQLLKFYHQNRDRSILVNAEKVKNARVEFLQMMSKKIAQHTEIELFSETEFEPADRCAKLLAHQMLDQRDDISALYMELESAADMPNADTDDFSKHEDIEAAIRQYQKTHISSRTAGDQTETQQQYLPNHQTTLKTDVKEHGFTSNQNLKAVEENNITSTELEELKEENELLLLQLHQVQEELEHYFKKYNTLANEKNLPPKPQHNLSVKASRDEVIIDMRHFIDGENWHYAEAGGRWSGPDATSTLNLSSLDEGDYLLEMHIAAAMSSDMIRRMKLIWQGQDLKFKTHQPWAGIKALLRRHYLLWFQNREGGPLILRAPLNVQKHSIGNDRFLKIICPRTISPQSRGQNDDRDLGLMLTKIKFTPQNPKP